MRPDHDAARRAEQHGHRDRRDRRRCDARAGRAPCRPPTRRRGRPGSSVRELDRPGRARAAWSQLLVGDLGPRGEPADDHRAAARVHQGRQLRRRRLRGRPRWSAPASASSTRRPRTRCTATSPGCPRPRPAAASASRSSCTSGPGRCCAASPRSPGPSTRWSAATPTSTWSSWRPSRSSTCPNFYGADARRHQRRRRLRPAAGALAAARPARSSLACAGGSVPAVGSRRAAPLGAVVALGVGADGAPGARPPRRRRRRWSPCPTTSRRCGRTDPALAQRWRIAVREALAALVADGGRIDGFDRAGWYVVTEGLGEAHRRRAAPHLDAAGRAVPHLVRHRDDPRRPAGPRAGAVRRRGRGLGRVRRDEPTRSTPRSTSTRRPTCCAASWSRRWPRPGRSTAHAVADGRWRRSRGTGWPRPRWRWRCSTRSCAPRAAPFARELGAVHDRVPCGVSVGIMDSIPALLDAVGGYLDEGYVRIKLKIEPGWDVEPVRAVRERFGDDVLLQVDANTAYTLADAPPPGPARPVRPAADRAAARGGGRARPRRAGQADHARRSASTSRSPRPQSAAAAIRLGACRGRQHQAGPGRRLPRGPADPRRVRRRTGSRSGAAGCSRPASAGPPTSRSPRCPGSRCPATRRRPTATTAADITEPFVLDDGHLAVPTGPGLGVAPLPDRLAEVTTGTEWLTL